MDLLFTPEFWSALLAIVVIDLVLAGDNAIVIGMAARNLPAHQQKKAIIWGTVGAIVIRALATMAVVWLLKIPGLMLVGGLILVWISLKLLVQDDSHENMKASGSLGAAIWTIIVADTVMGLDNVIAVAGAAHGDFLMVIIGLVISVPIMVWGSTMILKFMEKYPIVIYIGSAVLAYTAASMVTSEKFLAPFFAAYPWVKWVFIVAIVVGVLLTGRMKSQKQKRLAEQS
ncbi:MULTISPECIES: TerC family protein [Brevibacillus]|uniref:Integral membrane protein, YjbE family n=2 Tax=Brevibacillus TaxID=55080 RepID=A0A1I3WN24_9BACL|nr:MULTISPECIES: TerC family protein [Brevibacillus]MDR7315101.1 YjbE family integral membrane protein [Brevibacillus nitrificans]MEC2131061.1 TerC family protein [Brevibacillus centrosporus]MED1792484.1 TerC family protein [Brevibacillus nitrificans]MED1952496.1 TerC family protein [Brevibacillus centrosporus]MED4907430.1 TerC family protein [Brevibacillus centrosporus]